MPVKKSGSDVRILSGSRRIKERKCSGREENQGSEKAFISGGRQSRGMDGASVEDEAASSSVFQVSFRGERERERDGEVEKPRSDQRAKVENVRP